MHQRTPHNGCVFIFHNQIFGIQKNFDGKKFQLFKGTLMQI